MKITKYIGILSLIAMVSACGSAKFSGSKKNKGNADQTVTPPAEPLVLPPVTPPTEPPPVECKEAAEDTETSSQSAEAAAPPCPPKTECAEGDASCDPGQNDDSSQSSKTPAQN